MWMRCRKPVFFELHCGTTIVPQIGATINPGLPDLEGKSAASISVPSQPNKSPIRFDFAQMNVQRLAMCTDKIAYNRPIASFPGHLDPQSHTRLGHGSARIANIAN